MAGAGKDDMIITSILDTDLYKLTMQQAVREHYAEAVVSYRFTNRGKTLFSRKCFERIQRAVASLASVKLTLEERQWLERTCPYLKPAYLDWLLNEFEFKPSQQVDLSFEPVQDGDDDRGQIHLDVKGKWSETILYEVPLLAIVSESYFTVDDTKWDYAGQIALARSKGETLIKAGCLVSEFGTRRRRTKLSHDLVMRGLVGSNELLAGSSGKVTGTSNVDLARKYNVAPVGTIAHEWVMGIAAVEGYLHANGRAMLLWDKTYPNGELGIALTDTFSTKPFIQDFVATPDRSLRWQGLRQDSGDPFDFIPVAIDAFKQIGADPKKKVIVFSDALDVEKCVKLKEACDKAGVGCRFGVGTFFTNDFRRVEQPVQQTEQEVGSGPITETGEKSKALNIVMKLYRINDEPCVKISDDLNKNTGDVEAVKMVKMRFGLETHAATSS